MIDVAIDYLAFNRTRCEFRFQCKSRSKPNATIFDLSLPKDKRATLPTHVFYMRGPADRAEFWIVPFPVVKRITTKLKGRTGRQCTGFPATRKHANAEGLPKRGRREGSEMLERRAIRQQSKALAASTGQSQ